MLTGTVRLSALFPQRQLSFPRFNFIPAGRRDGHVEMESDGTKVVATVHFQAIATADEAKQVAIATIERTFDFLAFRFSVAIRPATVEETQLRPLDSAPNTLYAEAGGYAITGHATVLGVRLGPANVEMLKSELESNPTAGEPWWSLFRTALCITSAVERFLLFYYILLSLCPDKRGQDNQAEVDAFIRTQESNVTESPSPHFKGINETIYTRLRNEVTHRRRGVNVETTRTEITQHVGELEKLARRAVEVL